MDDVYEGEFTDDFDAPTDPDDIVYLDDSQFNKTDMPSNLPDYDANEVNNRTPYQNPDEKLQHQKYTQIQQSPPSNFLVRPKEPLKFLNGLQKGGLPFFAFEPVTYDDILYETNFNKYKASKGSNPPRPKNSGRGHVSTCQCVDCKKNKVKREKELVRAMYYCRKGNPLLIAATMRKNGFLESKNPNEWNICWSLESLLSTDIKKIKSYQKINNIPKITGIILKDELYVNYMKMKNKFPAQFQYMPNSYLFPSEKDQFISDFREHKLDGPFIVKPHNGSEGSGIIITKDINDIINATNDKDKRYIVSQYIEKPLLVDNLKFDIRLYVLITCVDPLRIYIYQEGLIRFATSHYTNNPSSYDEKFIHLTNYAINKFSENFVDTMEDDGGNKWTLTALLSTLGENGIDVGKMMSEIEDIVVKTIISIEDTIYHSLKSVKCDRLSCYQLLGFDIMIDEFLKPFLLEVNLAPSLSVSSPFDCKVKSTMIADLFTLIGIQPYDPKTDEKKPPNGFLPPKQAKKSFKGEWNDLTSKDHRDGYSKEGYAGFGSEYTAEENQLIKEMDSEYKRRGYFKRIYPTETSSQYNCLFSEVRKSNLFLCNYLFKNTLKDGEVSSAARIAAVQRKVTKKGK